MRTNEQLELEETKKILEWRNTHRLLPPLNELSFRYTIGSKEFFEDARLDAQIGAVGEVVEDVKGTDRLSIKQPSGLKRS